MKIRNGFVSNSSSSSFVVAFPKDVWCSGLTSNKTERVKNALFGEDTHFHDIEVDTVAEIVSNDMIGPYQSKKFCPHCGGKLNLENGWDDEDNRVAEKMLKKHPDRDIFIFNYSDEEGALRATMEHGGLFDRLPHERIDYH